jgi:hypothetical protein
MSIVLVVAEMEVVVLSIANTEEENDGMDKCYVIVRTSLIYSRLWLEFNGYVRAADGFFPKYLA